MQTDFGGFRLCQDWRGTLPRTQSACSRGVGTFNSLLGWCRSLACQPGNQEASLQGRPGRLGCTTNGHHPTPKPRPSLRAALTLALLVWAGPGYTEEVHVERVARWPGFPRGPAVPVAVAGPYAYVADWEAGLQVIDVSDPARPRRVGGYDTPGFAQGVAVSGNYAYVADRNWGLQIFRIEPVPRLDGPFGLTAEGFAAWLNAPAAGTYRIEVSSDLAAWETLVTLTNVSGRVRVVDPAATSAAQRFYRAVRVP